MKHNVPGIKFNVRLCEASYQIDISINLIQNLLDNPRNKNQTPWIKPSRIENSIIFSSSSLYSSNHSPNKSHYLHSSFKCLCKPLSPTDSRLSVRAATASPSVSFSFWSKDSHPIYHVSFASLCCFFLGEKVGRGEDKKEKMKLIDTK
ncbi:hypothetical protein CAEBREN_31909 [Caenorhabditis brenneri]|uniref:Uncharacterized protein n=1 Tax=Caenorhabditis brenneri TaxID=135651 RepID=G0PDD4_CAEBE|nr:hypothetical protein CAEBREN_31909 [Caenorhabditis brenneri]